MLENKKAFLQYMQKEGKVKSWNVLATMFDFSSGEAARSFYKRNKTVPMKVNYLHVIDPIQQAVPSYTSTYSVDKQSNTATINSTEPITTEDRVLDYCKLDKSEWTVKEIWTKEKQTKDTTHPLSKDGILSLYETTAKIHPKERSESFKEDFTKFVNEYKLNKQSVFRSQAPVASPNILIISLTDLHFDKKTYFEETEEYGNMELATSRALIACVDLVDRAAASHPLSKIVVLGGHDFFHGNTAANTTEKGTKLDVDGRWHQSFRDGLKLITAIIDYCRQTAPVEYYNVIGNHGPERDQYLAIALEAFYRNDDDVFIESVYNYRKYFSFGRSAFMLTHEVGNKIKDLPVIFATERPEMFARSKYRTVLTGHYHKAHETQFMGTNENYGIIFKVMPSLSSTDFWHHKNSYVQNQKSCIALVVNEDYGTIAELIYNE